METPAHAIPTTADAEKPSGVMLWPRLMAVAVIVPCAWILWEVLAGMPSATQRLGGVTLGEWMRFSAMGLAILVLPFAFAVFGVVISAKVLREPTRTRLAILSVPFGAIGYYFAFETIYHAASWALQPAVAEALGVGAFLPGLTVAAFVTIAVYRFTGKSAGLIPADERWWRYENIRASCIFLGWMTYASFLPLAKVLEDALRSPVADYAIAIGFFGPILLGVLIAKLGPWALCTLTGVDMPRNKRQLPAVLR